MQRGGFFTPGTRGQGAITGTENLLDFATQSFTGGQFDQVRGGEGFGLASLEPQSARLTMFGRRHSPLFQREQESQREAFGLFTRQIQYEEQLREQNEAEKKAFWTSLLVAAGSAALSFGVNALGNALNNPTPTGPDPGGGTVRGLSERPAVSLDPSDPASSASRTFTTSPTVNLGSAGAGRAPSLGGGGINRSAVLRASLPGSLGGSAAGVSRASIVSSHVAEHDAISLSAQPDLSAVSRNNTGMHGMGLDMGIFGTTAGVLPTKMTEIEYQNMLMLNRATIEAERSLREERRAAGGAVPYAAGVDTVPTMLSGGEFVMNAASTQNIGRGNLAAMNAGGGGGGDDSAVVARLDELIAVTDGSGETIINITVNSDGTETQSSEGESEDQQNLAERVRDAVRATIQEEQRLGGSLRRQ